MSETTGLSPIPARSWGIAACTGAAAFMAMLDSTVVNLAIESIRTDLGSTLPVLQWVATGYLCALAVSLPATAWLGSRYGYGRVWAISLAVFVVASILCALAPSSAALITARLLHGLAGGLMVPAGQAVIGVTVEKSQLGRIFGVLGLVIALGPAVGPAVGGYLLESASWRWVFWINVPVGVGALLVARGLVPAGHRDETRGLDYTGLCLLGVGLPLLLYGAFESGVGSLSFSTIFSVLTGLTLILLFVTSALRRKHPLIDLRLFLSRQFSSATVMTGLTGIHMYGGLLLIPLYLQLVLEQSVAEAGLWLLVMGTGSALALPLAGAMTDRIGASWPVTTGAVLLLLSTTLFLFPALLSSPILFAVLVIRGAALALAQMPAMTSAYASVGKEEMGDATTIVNIIQRLGGAAGAIGVVVVLQRAGGSADPGAHLSAFMALLGISVLTLFVAAMMLLQSRPASSEARGR